MNSKTFLQIMGFLSLSTLGTGCADYAMYASLDTGYYGNASSADFRSLRIDITPSDASGGLLPQSFNISPEQDWDNLVLELSNSTTIHGNISGYTIFPYVDINIPGEQVPVEAQVKIIQEGTINGNIVNSEANGNFDITIPHGENYQLSITPLSPQNVPYLIVDNLNFLESSTPLEIDLGSGVPIYGIVHNFSSALHASAQLIDGLTGIKGPQIDIQNNGYFQLRAPPNRNDFTIRIQGTDNELIPKLDIPVYVSELDTEGLRVDVDLGTLEYSTVTGRLLNSELIPFSERSIIRFESLNLYNSDGSVYVETNNDFNGYFNVTLLQGVYKMTIIPSYEENGAAAPISLEVTIDHERAELSDIQLPSLQNFSGIIYGIDSLPSAGVTVNFKDANFDQNTYSTITDDMGRFDIKLPPVLMNVSLIPGSTNAAISNFAVDLRNDQSDFNWTLQTGQHIAGQIKTDEYTVPFALIEIYQGGNLLANGLSGQDGEFALQIQIEE